MRKYLVILLFLISIICLAQKAKVVRVIDGDTFEIESGEKVRMIGINTPEISDVYGSEAKEYLIKLIENKIVYLQSDNLSKDRDRYQRLLRYVIFDNVDINRKMISDGFAFAYLKYKFSKSILYEQEQLKARENNQGIWGNNNNNNKDLKSTETETVDINIWQAIPKKSYLIGFLMIMLIFVGLFAYFKK